MDAVIKSNIFKNIDKKEIINILNNFKAKNIHFSKGNTIIDIGDKVNSIYIIAKGKIEISKEYEDARKNIVNILTDGDIFAEAFAFSSNQISSIQAISLDSSDIIEIESSNIFNAKNDDTKNKFIENLLRVISDKNKFLAFKNDILSQKSLRSKIIIYLKYISNI